MTDSNISDRIQNRNWRELLPDHGARSFDVPGTYLKQEKRTPEEVKKDQSEASEADMSALLEQLRRVRDRTPPPLSEEEKQEAKADEEARHRRAALEEPDDSTFFEPSDPAVYEKGYLGISWLTRLHARTIVSVVIGVIGCYFFIKAMSPLIRAAIRVDNSNEEWLSEKKEYAKLLKEVRERKADRAKRASSA